MALARIPAHDPSTPLDLAAFAAGLVGTIIRPGDEGYDTARLVHNRAFDRHPSLIVKAASAADVARTVVFARDAGLELAVRGGSHSLAGFGTSEGGIVLDLSGMKGLHIDPERRLAWAQAGLTAGEYTAAAGAHGLATPFGDTGSVGLSGLTLGGGIGWLVRKHGLAIDALVSVEIVTADGRLITASEQEHPDLFWAVRGGGGNFGVVTRFQFRLYPVGNPNNLLRLNQNIRPAAAS
jgi:FAD/FMN-containing dehydrogenase